MGGASSFSLWSLTVLRLLGFRPIGSLPVACSVQLFLGGPPCPSHSGLPQGVALRLPWGGLCPAGAPVLRGNRRDAWLVCERAACTCPAILAANALLSALLGACVHVLRRVLVQCSATSASKQARWAARACMQKGACGKEAGHPDVARRRSKAAPRCNRTVSKLDAFPRLSVTDSTHTPKPSKGGTQDLHTPMPSKMFLHCSWPTIHLFPHATHVAPPTHPPLLGAGRHAASPSRRRAAGRRAGRRRCGT